MKTIKRYYWDEQSFSGKMAIGAMILFNLLSLLYFSVLGWIDILGGKP